ncbi:MAG: mannitol dehydrogenase family protein [Pseudomonadota bacterium]
MVDRLNTRALATHTDLALPYGRTSITPGIVHFGVGNFHRAHQAVYVHDLLATDPRWGIIGVSLRRADMRDALCSQDWLYTVTQTETDHSQTRVIGALLDVLHAPIDPERVIDALAAPEIKLVTLTISEKGYGLDAATGELDVARDDVRHDLDNPQRPQSAIGFIVAALAKRRAAGVAPFTCMSCDNLANNGDMLRRLVIGYAHRVDNPLAGWIETGVAFPSTMVDRIVPATADADRTFLRDLIGLKDAWPVMTEPFKQWVIEDNFCNARPDFASVGAQLVDDVAPYELMKLRMLNGAHSLIAYLGQLRGRETVAEAVGDHEIVRRVRQLWAHEVPETVPLPSGVLRNYAHALETRFANTALKHRTAQIAADGTQKIRLRLLAPFAERAAKGMPSPALSDAIASWVAYVWRKSGHVDDPMASQLAEVVSNSSDETDFFETLLGDERFSGALAFDSQFLLRIVSARKSLPI